MRKIIFTRYSNERSPLFAIKTVIIKDENGNLGVEKYPCTEQAQQHIDNMLENQEKINKFYGGECFCAAPCHKIDGGISFDFIKGETFEEQLEKTENNIQLFYEKLKNLYDSLLRCSEGHIFEPSGEFYAVFGDVPLPSGLSAINGFACFDLAFGNIICSGDTLNIIDYEWCFDFDIPIEYIFYRALNIYLLINWKTELLGKNIFEYLGFNEKMISVFDKLEENFQQYIRKGCFSIRDLYLKFDVKNYNTNDIIVKGNEIFQQQNQCWSQIYLDYGSGFSESESIRKLAAQGQKSIIDIVLTDKVKCCRFDPDDNSCIMEINRIGAFCDSGMYLPQYTTNGCKSNDIIYFGCDDPQILFTDLKENTNLIQIEYTIIKTNSKFADGIAMAVFDKEAAIKQSENLKQICEQKQQQIEDLTQRTIELDNQLAERNQVIEQQTMHIDSQNQIIEQQSMHISQMENSRGWKVLQKMRKLMGR